MGSPYIILSTIIFCHRFQFVHIIPYYCKILFGIDIQWTLKNVTSFLEYTSNVLSEKNIWHNNYKRIKFFAIRLYHSYNVVNSFRDLKIN